MTEIIDVHGFTFIRHGSCKQCGVCGCGDCRHGYTENGKSFCAVYGDRTLVCDECSSDVGEEITHESCIGFPDNPWIGVVRDSVCGFWFTRLDEGSMDDLPFLYGGRYLR